MNIAKFYIKRQVNNEFYFILKSSNNETILKGEGYTTKQNCINGINSVKVNSPFDSRYERKTTWSSSQYYFVLKSINGQPIGMSEMYNSLQGRENGIHAVKRDAPNAPTVDLT